MFGLPPSSDSTAHFLSRSDADNPAPLCATF
jgi:hypothetical protein